MARTAAIDRSPTPEQVRLLLYLPAIAIFSQFQTDNPKQKMRRHKWGTSVVEQATMEVGHSKRATIRPPQRED